MKAVKYMVLRRHSLKELTEAVNQQLGVCGDGGYWKPIGAVQMCDAKLMESGLEDRFDSYTSCTAFLQTMVLEISQ